MQLMSATFTFRAAPRKTHEFLSANVTNQSRGLQNMNSSYAKHDRTDIIP